MKNIKYNNQDIDLVQNTVYSTASRSKYQQTPYKTKRKQKLQTSKEQNFHLHTTSLKIHYHQHKKEQLKIIYVRGVISSLCYDAEGERRARVNDCSCVSGFSSSSGGKKRATVGDAAVTWAGTTKQTGNGNERSRREGGGGAEVADSGRKISRRGS